MKPSETNISTREIFNFKLLKEKHRHLIERENKPVCESNGVFDRFEFPILTAAHTPLHWRYDLNRQTNPFGMERFGINATFNPGAIKWKDKYLLAVRVEGADRKSFIAIAESPNGFNRLNFGIPQYSSHKTGFRTPTCMTCGSLSTKMVGFTVFFVPKEKTRKHQKAIPARRWPMPGLSVPKI